MSAEAALVTGKLVADLSVYIIGQIVEYMRGSKDPATRRAAEVLPPRLLSDVEHERQRALLREEVEVDLGLRQTAEVQALTAQLQPILGQLAREWALAVQGAGPAPLPVGERETEPPANPFGEDE